jgi:hypothetical protein
MDLQLIKQSFRFHKCCSCVYHSRYYSITTDLVVAMYYLVSSVRMTLESSPPARVLCVWFVRLLSHVKILTQLSRLSALRALHLDLAPASTAAAAHDSPARHPRVVTACLANA